MNLDRNVFFICGCMKSGTTWLQILLDAHPQIACRGEGHFCNEFGEALLKAMNEYNNVIEGKNSQIFGEIQGFPVTDRDDFIAVMRLFVERMLGKLIDHPDIRMVGEKTPDNTRYLQVLDELFPRARFIHIVRDPRDVAVSGWHHNKRYAEQWLADKYGSFRNYALDIARLWKADVTTVLARAEALSGRLVELRYEDLLQAPGQATERLLHFLGVSCTPDIVQSCIERSSFETLAKGRKRGDSDESSLFRKGVIGDWKQHFDAQTLVTFEGVVGDLMNNFGYERSGQSGTSPG